MIDRDSGEYDLLARATAEVVSAQVPGLTCEIGVRTGGGTQVILDELARSPFPYTHIAIDPWGGLNYDISDTVLYVDTIYNDRMRRECLADLYEHAMLREVDLQVIVMTDREFFRRFETGVYVYRGGLSEVINRYAMVHFDGPHDTPHVLDEVAFFGPRAPMGAWWVFDDHRLYDKARVLAAAAQYGFTLEQEGRIKMVLRRTS